MLETALSIALAVLAWLGVLAAFLVVLFFASAAIAGIRQARREAATDRAFKRITGGSFRG